VFAPRALHEPHNFAMQRLTERCGARTPFDLLDAMQELWRAVERMVD